MEKYFCFVACLMLMFFSQLVARSQVTQQPGDKLYSQGGYNPDTLLLRKDGTFVNNVVTGVNPTHYMTLSGFYEIKGNRVVFTMDGKTGMAIYTGNQIKMLRGAGYEVYTFHPYNPPVRQERVPMDRLGAWCGSGNDAYELLMTTDTQFTVGKGVDYSLIRHSTSYRATWLSGTFTYDGKNIHFQIKECLHSGNQSMNAFTTPSSGIWIGHFTGNHLVISRTTAGPANIILTQISFAELQKLHNK